MTTNSVIYNCVWVLVAVGISGCIKEVSFKQETSPSAIAIYGAITNDPRPQELAIVQTGGFEKDDAQRPVIGAVAILQDDLGNKEQYIEMADGRYILSKTIVKGVPGRTYKIEIVLPDGKIIHSNPEKMPAVLPIEKLYGRNDSTQTLTLYADMTIPGGQEAWVRWEADRVRLLRELPKGPFGPPPKICYLWTHFSRQEANLFHSNEINDYHVIGQDVGMSNINSTFYERNCIQMYQFSTTAASYNFWGDVQKAANPKGTIFDTPPAAVKGNLHYVSDPDTPVFGFFEAMSVDTARLFVYRDEFEGIIVTDPCNLNYSSYGLASNGYAPECIDCLLKESATLEKPWFW